MTHRAANNQEVKDLFTSWCRMCQKRGKCHDYRQFELECEVYCIDSVQGNLFCGKFKRDQKTRREVKQEEII